MATITQVNATDSWDTGRTTFYANDSAINTQVIADVAALATHKSSTDHDAHNDTHNDARYAPISAVSSTSRPIVLEFYSGWTKIVALPAGTIVKVFVVMVDGTTGASSAFTVSVSAGDQFKANCDTQGSIILWKNGVNFGGVSVQDGAASTLTLVLSA